MKNINTESFWQSRYDQGKTEWDMGCVSPPIKHYIDTKLNNQDRELSILIAGAGNAYEARYLHSLGFSNVVVVDLATTPLNNLAKKTPTFNKNNLLQEDFFELDEKKYQFDLSIEQTFFCAIAPKRRAEFVNKTYALLKPEGRLVGVLWNCDFEGNLPPFGGSKTEYQQLFEKQFHFTTFSDCNNSHPKRQGRELFIDFIVKK